MRWWFRPPPAGLFAGNGNNLVLNGSGVENAARVDFMEASSKARLRAAGTTRLWCELKLRNAVQHAHLPRIFHDGHHGNVFTCDILRTHDFAAIEKLDLKLRCVLQLYRGTLW